MTEISESFSYAAIFVYNMYMTLVHFVSQAVPLTLEMVDPRPRPGLRRAFQTLHLTEMVSCLQFTCLVFLMYSGCIWEFCAITVKDRGP